MSVKYKITKEEHSALSDALKSEYKADGDDFVLDVTGNEDTGALKRAKDREKQRADDLAAELAEARKRLDTSANDDARKRGDIDTLEKSWQKKLDDANATNSAQLTKIQTSLKTKAVENTALTMANKISTSPKLLLPHIKERLLAEVNGDDEIVVRVLDATGKISAQSISDLEKDFVANAEFASIIIGSKATGGGSHGTNGGGAPKDFAKMNDAERVILHRENPAEFKRLSDEHRRAKRGH